MPRGENEKDRGTHGEQPPPRRGAVKGKRQRGDKASRACAHTHATTPPDTEDARERQKKKKRQNVYLTVSRRLLVVACGI